MKTALVTGASGFLGKYVVKALQQQGWQVDGLGKQKDSHIVADLSGEEPVITKAYDLIVHAAAKAHSVPRNEWEEQVFFNVNAEGTRRLCKGINKSAAYPQALVFISSIAVYGVEEGDAVGEEQDLKGRSPYAISKIKAEEILGHWCLQHNVRLTILRLPLVAGANPPGNLGAMVEAIRHNRYFNVSEGKARKSIVMASDVAEWIPRIAMQGGIYNLTDGYHPSFAELAACIATQLHKRAPGNIPHWLALPIAMAGNLMGEKAPIDCQKLRKITATLTFDDSKARSAFGWKPHRVLDLFTIN